MKLIWFTLALFPTAPALASSLEVAMKAGQWNDAAEISYEVLSKNPKAALERVEGSFALFQRGYANSALWLLKKMGATDWKQIPEGRDKMAEIVALFQKKVPLSMLPGRLEQLNPDEASPYLRDEIRFAKGREAFEKGDATVARGYLGAIAPNSRFFGLAHYLLGAIAVKAGDAKTAVAEFSRIFNSDVLNQSSEFWRDMGTQLTTHWGNSLRVMIDAESLNETMKVGELAVLGLARVAYGAKDFENALINYVKVQPQSRYFPRATLERIWSFLALGNHDEAQKVAAELSVADGVFEAVEARVVRALVLTDIGKSEEARQELEIFFQKEQAARMSIHDFEASQVERVLPAFLKSDLEQDIRLQTLLKYQEALRTEIDQLGKEDRRLFPVFSYLASELEPLYIQSKTAIAKLVQEHIAKRKQDLDALFTQAKLIKAETYLEDREKLRHEFRLLVTTGVQINEAKQSEHDKRLVALLSDAVKNVDDILDRRPTNFLRLEFRQSELLWELSGAQGIIAQTTHDKKDRDQADALRERSVRIAQKIAEQNPNFESHAQAMFFTGYAKNAIGRFEESFKVLEKYVKLYPKHTHTPDAYRIMADLRFDENRFKEAQELYKKIIDFPESPVVGYSLYKIGWCAYNLKDFSRSLLAFEKANLWALNTGQEGSLLSLKREARHDLILLYAEVGDHRKAFDYFSKFFQAEAPSLLAELAVELDRIGQFEKSTDLYHTLIALDPTSANDIFYQAGIVNGAYRLHNWTMVIGAARQLLEKYRAMVEKPESEESPQGRAEKIIKEAVLAQQFEVKKSALRSPEALERVITLDGLYLSAFGSWPSSEEPLYRHALFLIETGRPADAAESFRKHWLQFRETLKEPVREEALRNLVHALEVVESAEKPKEKTSVLTKSAGEILEYSAIYIKDYPKSKYTRPIAFLRSAIMLKYEQNQEGMLLSQQLFDEDPNDDIAKRVFKNLRVVHYDRKNWEETYGWASQMLVRKTPGMAPYVADLKAVREEALFLWADTTPEELKSADLFLKIADDPEMARLRDKALYNAFVRQQKAGRKIEALHVADRLEKNSPDFEKLPEISGVRAAFYQEAGDYTRAAPLLRIFLDKHDKSVPPATVDQARFNLALMSEALSDFEAATKLYKQCPESKKEEVTRALTRMDQTRKPKAATTAQLSAALLKAKADFERRPMPTKGDLAARIRTGAEALESVSKQFFELAGSPKTPQSLALEAYCAVPFLYEAYAKSVDALADDKALKAKEAEELRKELSKISNPLEARGKEVADQCLAKSVEAEHDGVFYRKVASRWGWMADAALKAKADVALKALEKNYPYIDAAQNMGTEAELIHRHFEDKGTSASWYALAKLRWDQKKPGLARLTIVDTLAKDPKAGQALNLLAVIDRQDQSPSVQTELYEKAAEQGSQSAWLNAAYLQLSGGRISSTINLLKHVDRLDDQLREVLPK